MSEDLHDNFDDADDEDLDLDRYDSAAGWDGSDAPESNAHDSEANPANTTNPANKDRYAHRLPYLPHESMFEVRPANAAMRTPPPTDLVPGLWRTGELALLIGDPNVGKSLLAVQIAESIARGRNALRENGKRKTESSDPKDFSPFTFPFSPASAQPVLLLDLDQTDAQFAERYTCPSPIPGKLPVKYRFSGKLIRPSYRDFGSIPEEFNDNLAKFFNASIDQAIAESGAKVIIIDNLAALSPHARNNSAHIRMLNSLKLHATTHNLSILVIASGQNRLRKRVDSAPHSSLVPRHLAELSAIADSVFSLNPTTFGPEYRYIKLLKTKTPLNSPPYEGGVAAASADGVVLSSDEVPCFQLERTASPLTSDSSTADRRLPSADCFLGMTFLGMASEEQLTRDYAAEQRAAEVQERSRIKKLQRSSREILVNGVLDGSYARYLKGE